MRRRPFIAALGPAWLASRSQAAAAAGAALADGSRSPARSSGDSGVPGNPVGARGPGVANGPAGAGAPRASADVPSVPPAPAPGSSSDVVPALGVSHRPLLFPADHGAHPDTHIEWWYVTGWLRSASGAEAVASGADGAGAASADKPPEFGFQVTFFRTRTGLGDGSASRFAARQVVFAHVALTDLGTGASSGGTGRTAGGLLHDQRVAREGFGLVQTPAASGPQAVRLRDWSLRRAPTAVGAAGAASQQRIDVRSDRFALALALRGTQPVMLQGDAGYSQKGPLPQQASHYYSEPQLAVSGRIERAGQAPRDVVGRAWLDHEWSDAYLPPQAQGWDWVGFNLIDGSALMAFRMRRADGSALWAGGSFRDAAGRLRTFGPGEVAFKPLRRWTSPRTRTVYPVDWQLDTPSGSFRIAALLDDQELDSRASTGALYWEGISALRSADGRVLGWGYLELTGYADRLRL